MNINQTTWKSRLDDIPLVQSLRSNIDIRISDHFHRLYGMEVIGVHCGCVVSCLLSVGFSNFNALKAQNLEAVIGVIGVIFDLHARG